MKLRSMVTGFALVLFAAGAGAQTGHYNSPIDVPTDARSVAMGESFVAVPSEPTALMANPAGLAGLYGIGISYSQRSFDWTEWVEDYRFHGANAYVEVPFGVFGLQYNRFDMGEIHYTTSSSPVSIGSAKFYGHCYVLGFGAHPMENLAVGIAAKRFNLGYDLSAKPNSGLSEPSFTPAYLFDGGVQYSLPFFAGDSAVEHLLTAGVSLQNIGTMLKVSSSSESESSDPLPRYVRAGISYQFNLNPCERDDLRPLAALVAVEYRRLLNSLDVANSDADYWGFGVECTAFEIMMIRFGGVIMPFTSIYGEREKPKARYGAGVRLPFSKLGLPLPLVISGNYAHIPIDSHPNRLMWGTTEHLSSFTVELEYVVP